MVEGKINIKPGKFSLKDIPDQPGVYLMKDAGAKVLYVGKASSLRKRLSWYLRGGSSLPFKAGTMMQLVRNIECRLFPTEAQAMLTEAGLIKHYQPKYNVSLRDDKSYPLVYISQEDFPSITICRHRKRKTGLYFGPYTNAGLLRQALKTIRRIVPFRSCRNMPRSACLNLHLRLCPAPCIAGISKSDYHRNISQARFILEGRQDELRKRLAKRMEALARQERYEEAAVIRDSLKALADLRTQGESWGDELQQLKDILRLSGFPRRIEGIDLSHLSGRESVGSLVSFHDGIADKSSYRRFRIKTFLDTDDLACLAEVVRRRYRRLLEETREMPDLLVIDGGKAHLNVALHELEALGLKIPVLAIAKEYEILYASTLKDPLRLSADNEALRLIQRVRDEAHRFARTYHLLLRSKKMFTTSVNPSLAEQR